MVILKNFLNLEKYKDSMALLCLLKDMGSKCLLDCLERNERNGIIYHREGVVGDYDEFDDVEKLIMFIKEGKR